MSAALEAKRLATSPGREVRLTGRPATAALHVWALVAASMVDLVESGSGDLDLGASMRAQQRPSSRKKRQKNQHMQKRSRKK